MPLVSVIMNCFNGEKYLRNAIDSVRAQSHTNWEIIFWDNQSTDLSSSIATSYDDERIRYFLSPSHVKLYAARNLAIEKARGEFISFLDVDDQWDSRKIENQLELLKKEKSSIVYGNYWILRESTGQKKIAANYKMPSGYILDKLLKRYSVGILTVLFKRDIVVDGGIFFNSSYHIIGDFDFIVRAALKNKISCLQEPCAIYRVHGSNESVLKFEEHINELQSWIVDPKIHQLISKSPSYEIFNLHFLYLKIFSNLLLGLKKEALQEIRMMPFSIRKVKALILFLLPTEIFVKLRSLRMS